MKAETSPNIVLFQGKGKVGEGRGGTGRGEKGREVRKGREGES
jgi:hypothetical protein